jgi:hypothetical protein
MFKSSHVYFAVKFQRTLHFLIQKIWKILSSFVVNMSHTLAMLSQFKYKCTGHEVDISINNPVWFTYLQAVEPNLSWCVLPVMHHHSLLLGVFLKRNC